MKNQTFRVAEINITRSAGLFFILSFISYAWGSQLVAKITGPAISTAEWANSISDIVFGTMLISLVHTVTNLLVLLLVYRVLHRHSFIAARIYFHLGWFATILLAIGGIMILFSIPMYRLPRVIEGVPDWGDWPSVLVKFNFYFYQLGMMCWSLGGLALCYVVYRHQLLPIGFPIWGFVGYTCLTLGSCFEIFGTPIGLILSIPGGLFEIAFSVWLLWKGI
jgi:hypothetical protein